MTVFEPGLFDKLFDDDRRAHALPTLRLFSLDEMKAVVARDLEALLNTRMMFTEEKLHAFPECKQSTLTYGLNDFSGLSLASFYDRSVICAELKEAIERHESRLKEVTVKLEVESQASTSILHFGISAKLSLPSMEEPVNFDALLQPTTLQYAVQRSDGRPR